MQFLSEISRKELQELPVYNQNQKYTEIQGIIGKVFTKATSGETQYIHPISKYDLQASIYKDGKHEQRKIIFEVWVKWMISALQKKLPDVTIEYKETTNLYGKLECGIVIDWS